MTAAGTWSSVSIRSWTDANRYYESHPRRRWPKVKLYNNTYLSVQASAHDASRIFILWHHSTQVITYYADGSIYVGVDRWRTVTTKVRLNNHLPLRYSISQRDYEWYVTIRPTAYDDTLTRTVPYQDGMVDYWLSIVS